MVSAPAPRRAAPTTGRRWRAWWLSRPSWPGFGLFQSLCRHATQSPHLSVQNGLLETFRGICPPRHPGRLSGPPELPPGALGSCIGLKVCTELPDSFFRMKRYAGAGWGLIQGAASPANRWKTVRKLPEATGRWDASCLGRGEFRSHRPQAAVVGQERPPGRSVPGGCEQAGWLELGHAGVGESCCATRFSGILRLVSTSFRPDSSPLPG